MHHEIKSVRDGNDVSDQTKIVGDILRLRNWQPVMDVSVCDVRIHRFNGFGEYQWVVENVELCHLVERGGGVLSKEDSKIANRCSTSLK